MRTGLKGLSGLLVGLLLLTQWGCAGQSVQPNESVRFRVLVFSKTEGFRHASIPAGIEAVRELGAAHNFAVEATEDAAAFTTEGLGAYDVVLFLNTTGDVLNDAQQTALEAFIRAGGGFAGVHAAADTEYDWAWYGGLVGAYFESHPDPQEATVLVTDTQHPSTAHLPERWTRHDEWYDFATNPRGQVQVLASLAPGSYEGHTMGPDHPIVWAHVYDGGRAWYTGLGHTDESYAEPAYRQHLLGGLEWAAGVTDGDVSATQAASFEKVVLTGDAVDPMELDIAADGRVFYIERAGAVKVWEPAAEAARQIGYIPVSMVIEDGLLGLALDPGFINNGWLYLYYAPPDTSLNRLSRFTYREDMGALDPASEVAVLDVQTQRTFCCHSAGALAFDPAGNLYLSTGDNTNADDRTGPPLDERPGWHDSDDQRAAGNTNDLRGKILRIHPEPDGSYSIPEGNLFPGDSLHRPEIYTMGHRNPFRIAVDPETGWLYWGDVGNGTPPSERGPWGWDEFNQARGPGFFGWPYFVGPNDAYREYDYETGELGPYYDPAAPVNDSPNNTGARTLPPAQPAFMWYTYGTSEEFPELGAGGLNPMAGPVYRYDRATAGPHALPPYYDGKWIIYEWMRNWVQVVTFDANGDLLDIEPFLPGMEFVRPMDMEVGPDGRLYVLEWGDTFWGSNANAQVVRLDYYGTAPRPPRAVAGADVTTGPVPLAVRFDGTGSHNRSGPDDALAFAWDFDADGQVDDRTPAPAHTYEQPGSYTARLVVTDAGGRADTASVAVTAGNTAPVVTIDWPPDGGFFAFDTPIPYQVRVSDPEDDIPDRGRLAVRAYAGFDLSRLLLDTYSGPSGTFRITRAFAHTPDLPFVDRFAELEAAYTDGGTPALTGRAVVRLHPLRMEAEHASQRRNAVLHTYGTHPASNNYGATALPVMRIRSDALLAYAPVNLVNVDSLTFRIKPFAGGTIDVRLDTLDGPSLASLTIDAGAGQAIDVEQLTAVEEAVRHDLALGRERSIDPEVYAGWRHLSVPLADPGGTHTLYLVVTGEEGELLMELDWIEARGEGIAGPPPVGSP